MYIREFHLSRSIQELVEQSEEERAVEEVEMLLQAYLMNLDNSWNKLQDINEYVEDTEACRHLLPFTSSR